jgi:hypothetical protein
MTDNDEYWKEVATKCFPLSRKYGAPTFFLTITMKPHGSFNVLVLVDPESIHIQTTILKTFRIFPGTNLCFSEQKAFE